MWKALCLKELRDTALVQAAASIALSLWLAEMTGWCLFTSPWNFDVINVAPTESINSSFGFILAGTAIALGLLQTVPESMRQTYLFLLHRPLPRRDIFFVKWLTGLAICVVLAVVPFVAYLVWAAAPGKHASPFVWVHTYAWWQCLVGLTLLYSGAFLSGVRPARWFGTRLFPLTAATIWFFFVLMFQTTWGWLCFLLILLTILCHAILLKVTLDEADRRDYP